MYTAENKTQLATDRKTITQMKVTVPFVDFCCKCEAPVLHVLGLVAITRLEE